MVLSRLDANTQRATGVLKWVDVKPREINITIVNDVEDMKLCIEGNRRILFTQHQCNVAPGNVYDTSKSVIEFPNQVQ